jgi:hypothetical protein
MSLSGVAENIQEVLCTYSYSCIRFMHQHQLQLACGCGSMSNVTCLPIITGYVLENNKTIKQKSSTECGCRWLTERSDISHNNLLRELEMSSLLDYKVYLQMFLYTFGELMETITSLIHREDMILTECCATPQIRPYKGNMFVKFLPYKLPDQIWTASQNRTVIPYLTFIHLCHVVISSLTELRISHFRMCFTQFLYT